MSLVIILKKIIWSLFEKEIQYLESYETVKYCMIPSMPGLIMRIKSPLLKSNIINRFETDSSCVSSIIKEMPYTANGWPSSENTNGPPGTWKQLNAGINALFFKPSLSHLSNNDLTFLIRLEFLIK